MKKEVWIEIRNMIWDAQLKSVSCENDHQILDGATDQSGWSTFHPEADHYF